MRGRRSQGWLPGLEFSQLGRWHKSFLEIGACREGQFREEDDGSDLNVLDFWNLGSPWQPGLAAYLGQQGRKARSLIRCATKSQTTEKSIWSVQSQKKCECGGDWIRDCTESGQESQDSSKAFQSQDSFPSETWD